MRNRYFQKRNFYHSHTRTDGELCVCVCEQCSHTYTHTGLLLGMHTLTRVLAAQVAVYRGIVAKRLATGK